MHISVFSTIKDVVKMILQTLVSVDDTFALIKILSIKYHAKSSINLVVGY